MPRFKLKTPFMVFARDQITGGVWYKPTWWTAFRKVPPGVYMPRPFKKRDLPKITYPEDRLIREFEDRNPMVAAREVINPEKPEESVVSQFVAKQVEEMERGRTKEQAYRLAEQWLIENGRDMLKLMKVFPHEKEEWDEAHDDIYKVAPHQMAMEHQRRVLRQIKESVTRDLERSPPPVGRFAHIGPHRHWRGEDGFTKLQKRTLDDKAE